MIGRATPRMPAAGYTTRRGFIDAPDLTTTVTTTGANQTFAVRTLFVPGGTGNIVIDWGDGTSARGVSSANHTYAEAGTYTLKVYGIASVENIRMELNPAFVGSTDDFAGLTELRYLALWATNLQGDIAEFATLTKLGTLWIEGTDVTGDIGGLSGLTSLTVLRTGASTALSGDIGDLSSLTGLTYLNLSGASSITGDLAAVTTMTSLQNLAVGGTGIDTYSGGALSSDLTFFQIQSCQFAATPLGSIVDTLHADRTNLGNNGCQIFLNSNPGSASVASSHSTKISELQAAGCTVTI